MLSLYIIGTVIMVIFAIILIEACITKTGFFRKGCCFLYSMICITIGVYCFVQAEKEIDIRAHQRMIQIDLNKKVYKVELWYLGGFKDTIDVEVEYERDIYVTANKAGLYAFRAGDVYKTGVVNFKILKQYEE